MRRILIILPIIILLISCRKDNSDKESTRNNLNNLYQTTVIETDSIFLDSLESEVYKDYCHPKDTLIAKYGNPSSIQYDTIANVYYGGVDSLVKLTYPGLKVELLHVCGDGIYLLTGVTLSDSIILSGFGFPKGMLRDSLEAKLHKSYTSFQGQRLNEIVLKYLVSNNDVESFFQFKFINGKLQEIEYLPWLD